MVLFYVADRLGSTAVTVRGDGTVRTRYVYTPFGELVVSEGTTVHHGFTGGHRDAPTGMLALGPRHYDPELGRMLQPDPLVASPGNPQSFNRYGYALNSPTNLSDPSGLAPIFGSCGPAECAPLPGPGPVRPRFGGGGIIGILPGLRRSPPGFVGELFVGEENVSPDLGFLFGGGARLAGSLEGFESSRPGESVPGTSPAGKRLKSIANERLDQIDDTIANELDEIARKEEALARKRQTIRELEDDLVRGDGVDATRLLRDLGIDDRMAPESRLPTGPLAIPQGKAEQAFKGLALGSAISSAKRLEGEIQRARTKIGRLRRRKSQIRRKLGRFLRQNDL